MESSIYAIIKSGGKQYKVAEGDVIDVELLDADLGAEIAFDDILFISGKDEEKAQIGQPGVSGYFVKGELMDIVPGPKVTSMKYKPSHHQYRKWGHRQHYSRVKITGIGKNQEAKKG